MTPGEARGPSSMPSATSSSSWRVRLCGVQLIVSVPSLLHLDLILVHGRHEYSPMDLLAGSRCRRPGLPLHRGRDKLVCRNGRGADVTCRNSCRPWPGARVEAQVQICTAIMVKIEAPSASDQSINLVVCGLIVGVSRLAPCDGARAVVPDVLELVGSTIFLGPFNHDRWKPHKRV